MENMFVRKIRRLPIQGENSLSKKCMILMNDVMRVVWMTQLKVSGYYRRENNNNWVCE
jgi:hypothetical protein